MSKQSVPNFKDIIGEIEKNTFQINHSPQHTSFHIEKVLCSLRKSGIPGDVLTISNSQLEELFGVSATLAFTLWQHFAAIERISKYSDWQCLNPKIWNDIKSASSLCGLATTHLAKPGSPLITGKPCHDGFQVNGEAPFVSGYSIFDHLVLGFVTDSEVVFAVIDFPHPMGNEGAAAITPLKLSHMGGTSTVKIKFNNYFISSSQVISRRQKDSKYTPTTSQYIAPDLGIGKYALKRAICTANNKINSKSDLIFESARKLSERLSLIEAERSKFLNESQVPSTTFLFNKDEFIRDSVRLMSIAEGSRSFKTNSHVLRLQSDLLLLDTVVQPIEVIQLKIRAINKDPAFRQSDNILIYSVLSTPQRFSHG